MPNASTFEVLGSSAIQEQFVIDSLLAESTRGACRLTFSEWEEDAPESGRKIWVVEYAIELNLGDRIAFGTYSTSFPVDERGSAVAHDALKRTAENDFMLCCKLIGRSVRRDLVVDQDISEEGPQPGVKVH